ncbi:MAG: glycosyltransferase family 4 protein [Acetobacteraceae bacterium]
MRIAQIAPLTESVPPRLYGGTERVVSFLTEQLVAMGHEVTLFASGDSRTSAELAASWPCALRFDPTIRDAIAPHLLMLEQVYRRAHEFDVLHCHLDYWTFSLLGRQPTPFLTTLHGRLDLPELRPIYDAFPEVPLVSISDAQRAPLPDANFVATVQHGLPIDLLTPQPVTPHYLAFLGRICPEKRPDRAIRIARAARIPLKIAAKVDRADEAYFREVIRPMIDDDGGVELIGEISDAEKPAFLSGAIALLLPIDWPEPFGLVMIEAMACGTPVIAFNRGSVPEIIEHGTTGLIVEDEAQAVAAIERVAGLSRAVVRQGFEQRFTAQRMAEDYLGIYRRLATKARPALRIVR